MKKLLPLLLLFNIFIVFASNNPPSGTISYNSPFCQSSTLEYVIMTGLTPGGTFSASPNGLSINAVTGEIQPSSSMSGDYMVTYTIPAGVDPEFSVSTAVTIHPYVTPEFFAIASHCPGSAITPLPTTSTNGITGTWSPIINNQITTVYTFTPNVGQCAVPSVLTIAIGQTTVPQFSFGSNNICNGSSVPVLPNISVNGIEGTWSPSTVSSTMSGVYMFTPNVGFCASNTIVTFNVSTLPTATISAPSEVCSGSVQQFSIMGTPSSMVTYSINGAANQVVSLDSSGFATIYLGEVTVSSTITLINVYNNSTGCTNVLNESHTITVTSAPVIAPINNVSLCHEYILPALPVGNYFTNNSGSGVMLNAGDVVTSSQQLYVFAQNACFQTEVSFHITIGVQPVLIPMPDVVACGFYQLPVNNDASYYSGPNGTGMMLSGNITNSQEVYVYATSNSNQTCVAEDSFHVTIIPTVYPFITTENQINYIYVDGITIVQSLLLDAQVSGNYSYQWMESHNDIIGATNATYLVNAHIDQGWHYYSVRITNNDTNCTTESPLFQVFETPVPAPVGNPSQTFTPGQTLSDIVVSGSNIQWYNVLNRNTNSSPLPLNTPLVNGVTYYATQTINGHESASTFSITIQFALANNSFHFKDLKYSPNPVENILDIKSSDLFKNVKVYNNLGQEVYAQKCNTLDLRLELGFLKTGNYFVKLESDTKQQVVKIIKR